MKKFLTPFVLMFCISTLLISNTKAQTVLKGNEIRQYKEALEFAKGTNNNTAIAILNDLYKKHPDNIDIAYNLGICHMNMSGNPDSALFYFNRVLELDKGSWSDSRNELYLAIARTHQLKYEYNEALEIYNQIEQHDTEKIWADNISREREICKNAKNLISTPVKLEVKTIDNINSEYNDYRPVISRDKKTLIFTSRRGNGYSNFQDGQYEESTYQANFNGTTWDKPEKINDLFNDKNEQESATCLANSDTELYLCKNGLIYLSKKDTTTGKWQKAEMLNEPINDINSECKYAYVSSDGSELFFSSNREGGFGGFDIYRSYRLPNGKWGIPRNLGDIINTPFDEDAPILNSDESILYFSSNGHNTMGGFDIFYAIEKPDSTFEIIKNIGYPINTPDDDIYFVPSSEKDVAYYASIKWNDKPTGFDIYQVIYDEPEAQKLAIISGYIKTNDLYDILIYAEHDGERIGRFAPNRETGKFIVIAEAGGTYNISASNSERTIEQTISTKENESYLKSGHLIELPTFDFLQVDNGLASNDVLEQNAKNKQNSQSTDELSNDGKKHYTVQFMSLRHSCKKEDTRLDIEQVSEIKYRNGWYVYTFGTYDSISEARKAEQQIKAKGIYNDAFVRDINQYKQFTE